MKLATSLLILFVLVALSGCHVPLQPYRLGQSAIVVPVETTTPKVAKAPTKAETKSREQACSATGQPICLTFIELDDMGELFDKVEVHNVLDVIIQANNLAGGDPAKAPIVIAFVHGWKNNASDGNDNVEGFQLALQAVQRRLPGRPVIGVYIGWRGNLIKPAWAVAQQFSYYNREATAIRVPGATLATALSQIAARTHENKAGLAIYVGHSFGGLLLERAVSETTANQIAQDTIFSQEATAAANGPDDARDKAVAARLTEDSRADLVIFINPAGAATEAKQFLNFLVDNSYSYQPFVKRDGTANTATTPTKNHDDDRPLFVSLTSTADMATKLALPIGHWWPDVKFKGDGSFRDVSQEPNKKYDLACFDPHRDHPHWELKTKADGAPDQSSYYMSTAPHMQVLQSHLMLKATGANEMQVASTGQKIAIKDPQAIAQCDRDLFNKQGLDIVSTFRLYDTQTCFAVQERPNRCNGTPYWMMELDPTLVPDHSTIFTERFIQFLIDTYFQTPTHQPLQRVSPQLVQTQ
jgi:hypothetical protein